MSETAIPAVEAPVVLTPSPASAVSPPAEAAPAPASDPVVAPPTVVSEPVPAEAAAPKPTAAETPTLMEEAEREAAKPAPEPPKPAETPAEAPAPTYEFKLPDGVETLPETMTAYTALLAENKMPQEAGQKLLDLHIAAIQKMAEQMAETQQSTFLATRKGWQDQVMADPELGGAGFKTTSKAVARMIDLFVPPEHRAEFDEFRRITGAGDHPALWRLMNNLARRFDEPAAPAIPAQPPPNRGAKQNGRGNFRGAMYDHPSSQRAASR